MTTVRMLTPRGRGAIAVVVIKGPNTLSLVDRWFVAANKRRLADQAIDRICFGRWLATSEGQPDTNAPGEELVVVRTAVDRVEVHCHGGVAAPAAVIGALVTAGAIEQADTPHPITRAPTERVAGILLDQVNGALADALGLILGAIEKGRTDAAVEELDRLLSRERLGTHLTTPWRVVLAGPPNVGKSSLINALVGYDRAIVYDQAGTTRDVVTASTAIDGWPVTLADTAGIRRTDDALESAGVELARQTLSRADVVLLIDEAAGYNNAKLAAEREDLRKDVSAEAVVIEVASKIDLAPREALPPGVLPTAAPQGVGIDTLVTAIGNAFGVECPPAGTAVPYTAEQYDTLRAVRSLLKADERSEAAAALQALLATAKA